MKSGDYSSAPSGSGSLKWGLASHPASWQGFGELQQTVCHLPSLRAEKWGHGFFAIRMPPGRRIAHPVAGTPQSPRCRRRKFLCSRCVGSDWLLRQELSWGNMMTGRGGLLSCPCFFLLCDTRASLSSQGPASAKIRGLAPGGSNSLLLSGHGCIFHGFLLYAANHPEGTERFVCCIQDRDGTGGRKRLGAWVESEG